MTPGWPLSCQSSWRSGRSGAIQPRCSCLLGLPGAPECCSLRIPGSYLGQLITAVLELQPSLPHLGRSGILARARSATLGQCLPFSGLCIWYWGPCRARQLPPPSPSPPHCPRHAQACREVGLGGAGASVPREHGARASPGLKERPGPLLTPVPQELLLCCCQTVSSGVWIKR